MKFPDIVPAKESPSVATMAPDRNPVFKVHRNAGLAHSAIAAKKPEHEIAKYELRDGEWVKVWEYVLPEKCEKCGGDFESNRIRRYGGNYHLEFAHKGTVMDAPVVCGKCYNESYEKHIRKNQEEQERLQLARLQAKYQ